MFLLLTFRPDCHPEQHEAEMHRLEQGPGLHRLRRRRRTPQGAETGGREGRQSQGPGSALKPLHEPDPGGTQWTDPSGRLERDPPEADVERPVRPHHCLDAL